MRGEQCQHGGDGYANGKTRMPIAGHNIAARARLAAELRGEQLAEKLAYASVGLASHPDAVPALVQPRWPSVRAPVPQSTIPASVLRARHVSRG